MSNLVPLGPDGRPCPTASLTEQLGLIQSVLPELLLGMLERRSLDDLQPEQLLIEAVGASGVHYRRISGIGRQMGTGDRTADMARALGSCIAPGRTLVWTIFFDGNSADFLVGARTHDVLASVRSQVDQQEELAKYSGRVCAAFRAAHTGMIMDAADRKSSEAAPAFARFLEAQQSAVGMITGIPGLAKNQLANVADRLFEAAAQQKFAVIVAAESLGRPVIDDLISQARRLKDEIHLYVNQTLARGRAESQNISRVKEPSLALQGGGMLLSAALSAAAVAAGQPYLAPIFSSMGSLATQQEIMRIRDAAETFSAGSTLNESLQLQVHNSTAAACSQILSQYEGRLGEARNEGGWNTAVYLVAEDAATVQLVAAVLRGLYSGTGSTSEPFRLHLFAPEQAAALRKMASGAVVPRLSLAAAFGHTQESLGSCMNSKELALLTALPHQQVSGLAVRWVPDFPRTVPQPQGALVRLGRIVDHAGRELQPIGMDQQMLVCHTLVAGMPASGKTTACKRILLETKRTYGVNCLVIESAKREYQDLRHFPEFTRDLRVFTIGDTTGIPLRLNPFQIVPGIALETHIDHIKHLFLASFDNFSGLSPVVSEAIREAYLGKGWNISASSNPHLTDPDSLDQMAALTPNLEEVHAHVERTLDRKRYAGQIHTDMRAAIQSRFDTLRQGNLGAVLNTHRSTPLRELFNYPAIIELEGVGNDDDKALVVGVLMLLLWEHASVQHAQQESGSSSLLRHLTLIEEAHRLLRAAPRGLREGVANPRGSFVEQTSNRLLEMRALGEGFIIADQTPTLLAPEVMAATGTKIALRMTSYADREAMGEAMGLEQPAERHFLSDLEQGVALVKLGNQSTTVARVENVPRPQRTEDGVRHSLDERILQKSAGCQACPRKCDFYFTIEPFRRYSRDVAFLEDAPVLRFQPFLASLLLNDPDQATAAYRQWYNALSATTLATLNRSTGDAAQVVGSRFCASVELTVAWLRELLMRFTPRHTPLPPPEVYLRAEHIAAALSEPLLRLASQHIRELDNERVRECADVLRDVIFEGQMSLSLPSLASSFRLSNTLAQRLATSLAQTIPVTREGIDNGLNNVVGRLARDLTSTPSASAHLTVGSAPARNAGESREPQGLPEFLLQGLPTSSEATKKVVAAVIYHIVRHPASSNRRREELQRWDEMAKAVAVF